MPLSVSQLGALREAHQILEDAGLVGRDNAVAEAPGLTQLQDILDLHLNSHPHPFLSNYTPPTATPFTPDELQSGENRITRQGYVQAIVEHPAGATVEYPQTGSQSGEAVAHRFCVDPKSLNVVNPKLNIQYSLGDEHGSRANVTCHLLRDIDTQDPVSCRQTKISCKIRISHPLYTYSKRANWT